MNVGIRHMTLNRRPRLEDKAHFESATSSMVGVPASQPPLFTKPNNSPPPPLSSLNFYVRISISISHRRFSFGLSYLPAKMPPIRTEKSSAAKKSSSLAAFFVKVDRNEALARAIKVQPKAPKTPEAPQHAEPSPTSQSATPPASSMVTTPTDSKSLPEEGDGVIDLVTTDKVVLPVIVPQKVATPSEPQPSNATASSTQPLRRLRRPDTEKGTKNTLFQSNQDWRTDHLYKLGSSTRQIVFGTETQLTS